MKTRTLASAVRQGAVLGLVGLISLAGPPRLGAADFVRGDANGDGRVSIADAQTMFNYLYLGHTSPSPEPCPAAWNVDGDSAFHPVSDLQWLLSFTALGGPFPLPPFPTAGPPDPSSGETCDSYGGGSPLPDPDAELKVVDTVVEGPDGTAFIKVVYSSSFELGGLSGTIKYDTRGLFGKCNLTPQDWAVDMEKAFAKVIGRFRDRGIDFTLIAGPWTEDQGPTLESGIRLLPGKDVPLLTAPLCVVPGTPPGDYPLTLAVGELADLESGRAIVPRLVSGVLHVKSEVSSCNSPRCPTPPPAPPDPDPGLKAEFKLRDASASPGDTFSVPLVIRGNAEVGGFSYSLDFGEEVLEAVKTTEIFKRPDGEEWFTRLFYSSNSNDHPGNAGIDEGFLAGAGIFGSDWDCLSASTCVLPRDQDVEVLSFEFKVKPGASPGTTEIRFLDGAQPPTTLPIINVAVVSRRTVFPDGSPSNIDVAPSQVNARVNIISDVTLFVRGDTNGDAAVDITDAQATLGYFFLGGAPPACYDAADANDDGDLDITDPVFTLGYLFLGGSALPAPFPGAGKDSTEDPLRCLSILR